MTDRGLPWALQAGENFLSPGYHNEPGVHPQTVKPEFKERAAYSPGSLESLTEVTFASEWYLKVAVTLPRENGWWLK